MTKPRVLAAAGSVAVVAVIVAMTLAGPGDSRRIDTAGRRSPRPESGASALTAPPTLRSAPAAVAAGFAHSPDGARAAALAYLAAGPSLATMDEDPALATQRAMASAGAGDELATSLRRQRAALVEGFGAGPLRWWVGPLATRVVPDGPDAAEVAIWYVSVVAPAERPTFEEWRLSRTELVWEAGSWRVAAEHDGPGPRPGVLARPEPSSPAELAGALAGFVATGPSA